MKLTDEEFEIIYVNIQALHHLFVWASESKNYLEDFWRKGDSENAEIASENYDICVKEFGKYFEGLAPTNVWIPSDAIETDFNEWLGMIHSDYSLKKNIELTLVVPNKSILKPFKSDVKDWYSY